MLREQRLIAVKVPWMVSPSVPYLRLQASESASDDPTMVRFVAYFGQENAQAESVGANRVCVAPSPYASNEPLGPPTGPYQVVRVEFAWATASRMLPGYSDRELVNPDLYDSSAVRFQFKEGQSINECLLAFRSAWQRDGVCPDSRMYEVENSLWIAELSIKDERLRHFLILGHDAYVEVIARAWKWTSEGSTY